MTAQLLLLISIPALAVACALTAVAYRKATVACLFCLLLVLVAGWQVIAEVGL